MRRATWMELFTFLLMLLATAASSDFANSQTLARQVDNPTTPSQNAPELLKTLDRLAEQNRQLENHNQELMNQIVSFRQILTRQAGSVSETTDEIKESAPSTGSAAVGDPQRSEHPKTAVKSVSSEEEPYKWGGYTPNLGYKIANTDRGDLSISVYSYARYLNQLGLDATYKDAFGNPKSVQQRQDFQLQKVQIKFLGWIMDPKLPVRSTVEAVRSGNELEGTQRKLRAHF